MKRLLSLLCWMGIMFALQMKLLADPPLYMVVYDLDKTEWKVRYTNDGPDLTDDTCRTTELWLRYIPAGKFMMGSPEDELGRAPYETQYEVTLTQPYYIGVFECTQKQWELVKGGTPSEFKGDCRPVEKVSYDDIRGAKSVANWPDDGHAVDGTSFMGILRAGTGLTFDLPTSAQWEYACRAGTTHALNSDEDLKNKNKDTAMGEVGRYCDNIDGQGGYYSGHTTVGSYKPNNWGLYDMHGNVWEWCLDWGDMSSPYDASPVEDPEGYETGDLRVVRSGSFWEYASCCRSAYWNVSNPSSNWDNIGFRVLCLMPPETYAVTIIDGTADKAEAAEGETVTITADEPADDEEFDGWTTEDGVEFANANDVQTSFTMPAAAVTVTATYKAKAVVPKYLVVYDLDKTEWKVRYTNDDPDLTDDTCRTTELWLRYIPAGKFMMGSPTDEVGRFDEEVRHEVTLTKPFYIGVFECTQKQWELVMGNRPSYFENDAYYATRPVEMVSYDDIRGTGAQAGAGWPTYGHAVDETSFMGILRAGTGLTFDLPTEAQWEYACRAGTTTALNSDKNLGNAYQDAAMDEVGRYFNNVHNVDFYDKIFCDTTGGTAKVGSYLPNNWGLFDMHGNVWEWCLDWCEESSYDASPVKDPVGYDTGDKRALRGGSWFRWALYCRSAYPGMSINTTTNGSEFGFRVLCLMPPETYAVTVVDGTADKTAAAEGDTVTITADKPADDEEFDKWVGEGVEFANANDVQTSFVMPAVAVTVTATYKAKVAAEFTVTVVNGVADKATAAKGETVTITADDRFPSHDFLRWTTSSGVKFAKSTSSSTTFVMPAKDVTVKATYKVLPKYAVKVTGGTADKASAAAGETVTITANAPAAGKQFSKWTCTGLTFENANVVQTTFVMPARLVVIKANFTAK